MEMILGILDIWILSYVVFHMNPLNDRTNPLSSLHYFHPGNIAGREELEKLLKASDPDDKEMVIHWADVWPYLYPSLITILCVIIIMIMREIPAF